MPPCLLIKAVIINSDYDEAPVLYQDWILVLSLTIVLGISMTCNFSPVVFLTSPARGGRKITCSRHCTDGEDMNRNKKKRPGTGGVIVLKWKLSTIQSGKRCLEIAVLQGSAVHFEGKK